MSLKLEKNNMCFKTESAYLQLPMTKRHCSLEVNKTSHSLELSSFIKSKQLQRE